MSQTLAVDVEGNITHLCVHFIIICLSVVVHLVVWCVIEPQEEYPLLGDEMR